MDTSDSLRLPPAGPPQAGESSASTIRIDPAASAALAAAVRSARQDLKPESAAVPPKSADARPRLARSALPAQAAAALLLIGVGWAASYTGTLGTRDAIRHMEAEAARSQEILARLTEDLAALKSTMAAVRDVEHTSSVAASGQAKLAEKIDRLSAAIQDPGKKLTSLEDRLNRMEGQIMTSLNNLAAAKAVVPPAATPAATAPQESAPAVQAVKAEPVEGWVLREVYNGSALVEGRNRRLYEVMPGNVIPGVGRVEAIERRGTRWVVVTDKGFIGTYR